MADTLEIPKERWNDYLTALSNRENRHPVSIRIEGREFGDQTLADHLPLVGISCEMKGSMQNAIEITVGENATPLTHYVAEPARVYVEEADNGSVRVLDIEDGAQVKTLIFFDTWKELPAGHHAQEGPKAD